MTTTRIEMVIVVADAVLSEAGGGRAAINIVKTDSE